MKNYDKIIDDYIKTKEELIELQKVTIEMQNKLLEIRTNHKINPKATKYYAVKVGRKPGIYTSWNTCKKYVSKYENAKYKSFKTLEEAENYLNNKQ